jgi:NhaA family Na+:H+ antiporter
LLRQCESALHPWVAYAIMPAFAFANAGLSLSGIGIEALAHPIALGIILGLFLGKQLGVLATVWIACAFGVGRLPEGVSWRQMHGAAILTGIGFTMSLFIGSLAFGDSEVMAQVRLGVIVASVLSAVVGLAILRWAPPAPVGPPAQR